MRMNKFSVVWIALVALPCHAQVTASGANWGGIKVSFDARIEPSPNPATDPAVLRQLQHDIHGGVIVDQLVHRYWQDPNQKTYLAYDLSVEPGPNPRFLEVRIAPLSLTPQQMVNHGFPQTWTRLSLPKYPVIPQVQVGDTVALDLMVNASTGQKLVDYLTLRRTGSTTPARPHDFSLADAGLYVNRPRITVNQRLVPATAHSDGGISGPIVWLYLQGVGRFVLSLLPKPEFGLRGTGEVSGNVLTFHDGADTYRIECSGQIAPGPGLYNIYVFHDRGWRPVGMDANEPFILGSAPLEALIRK